jgi:hypothetical protein
MTGYVVATTEDGRSGWLREKAGVRHFRFVVPAGPATTPGAWAEYHLQESAEGNGRPLAVITAA